MQKPLSLALALLALAASLPAQWITLNPVTGVREQPNGIELSTQSGVTRIEDATASMAHVLYLTTS